MTGDSQRIRYPWPRSGVRKSKIHRHRGESSPPAMRKCDGIVTEFVAERAEAAMVWGSHRHP